MRIGILSLVLGIFLLMPTGCYKDKEDLLYGAGDCDTTMVSFSMDIQAILNVSCATVGCHVQGGLGNGLFENYNQVKSKVDNGSLRQRVLVQRDMPPSSPLSDCQLAHIEAWLNDGAPNN